ncbi:MAG: IS5/IS1182 family transposase, partial [Conexivisphaerales archaeon]
REELGAMSIIPARNEDVPVWRTKGRYRKEMKRGYSKKYHQRSMVETIFSVIKRTMGDEIRSVKTVAQNNEMRAKIIGYNAARIVDMASSLFGGFLQSLISTTFN